MNFLDLPNDIQEIIYNKLNVIDKCAFNISAKFQYIKRQFIETHKKIGILYKLIIKKQIRSLSFDMTDFLSEYYKTNESDPSIQDIAIQFPEIIGDKPPETLYGKIRLGIITVNDLKDVTYYNIQHNLYNVIAQQNVTIFKILYGNECIKNIYIVLKHLYYLKLLNVAMKTCFCI